MPTSTVTSKGQITIPETIREALRLQPGDEVLFVRHHDGRVEMVARNRSVEELIGICSDLVPPGLRPATVEEMNEAIGEEVAALDRATLSTAPNAAPAERPKRRRKAA